jgi:hypothetical protein
MLRHHHVMRYRPVNGYTDPSPLGGPLFRFETDPIATARAMPGEANRREAGSTLDHGLAGERAAAVFSLARSPSGDVPSALATYGDAASGVGVRLFGARGEVAIAKALATGPRVITATRTCERGANTPDSGSDGNRGGGINAASLAKQCTGVITRCVAPLRRGMHRRYATRPSGRIDERSKRNGGRAQ